MTTLAILTALLFQAPASGEDVLWRLEWREPRFVGGRTGVRILGTPADLWVIVTARNRGATGLTLASPVDTLSLRFSRQATHESPATQGGIKVNRCWSSVIDLGEGRSSAAPLDPVELSPGERVTYRCSVVRSDGLSFSAGVYRVEASTTWPTKTPRGRTLKLEIGPPRTAHELMSYHLFQGNLAEEEGLSNDLNLAVRHYEAAVAAAPDNYHPYLSLAYVHDRAGRVTDAIRAYEAALSRPGALAALKDSRVPEFLARDYVRTGNHADAIRVLRLVGRPEARIEAFIQGSAPPRR
jgi:hypothetical protein